MMKYPFLDIIDRSEGMIKNKSLVLASYKPADLDETELNIFATNPYLSNEDVAKIIDFASKNKEELGFGNIQR